MTWAKGLPAGLAEAVLVCIAEVKQRPVNPARTGTDAKTIVALWRREGKPDPETFRMDLLTVIRWARESTDKLAARDIRAEGWPDGVDRHADLSTLTRQDKWSVRLDAARKWANAPTPAPEAVAAGVDWQEMEAARDTVAKAILGGGEIIHRDARTVLLGKRVLARIGKRDVWRGRVSSPEWAKAWRETWPAVVAEFDAQTRGGGQ